jgi:hypothetical protein
MITAAGKELTAEQMQHIFASRFPGGILNHGYHESSPYRKAETEAQKFYGGNNILTYGPDSAGLYGKTKRITLAPMKGVGMFTFRGVLPSGEGSLYLRMYSPIFGMRKDLLGEIKLTSAGEAGWLGDVQVKKDRTFAVELKFRSIEELIERLQNVAKTIREKELNTKAAWPIQLEISEEKISENPIDFMSPAEKEKWEELTAFSSEEEYQKMSGTLKEEFKERMAAQLMITRKIGEKIRKLKEGAYKHGVVANLEYPNTWIEHLNMQLNEIDRVVNDLKTYIAGKPVRISVKQTVSLVEKPAVPVSEEEVRKVEELGLDVGRINLDIEDESIVDLRGQDSRRSVYAQIITSEDVWDEDLASDIAAFHNNFERLKVLYTTLKPKVEEMKKIVVEEEPEIEPEIELEEVEEIPGYVPLPIAAKVDITNRLTKVADTLEARGMRNIIKNIDNILEFFAEVHKVD